MKIPGSHLGGNIEMDFNWLSGYYMLIYHYICNQFHRVMTCYVCLCLCVGVCVFFCFFATSTNVYVCANLLNVYPCRFKCACMLAVCTVCVCVCIHVRAGWYISVQLAIVTQFSLAVSESFCGRNGFHLSLYPISLSALQWNTTQFNSHDTTPTKDSSITIRPPPNTTASSDRVQIASHTFGHLSGATSAFSGFCLPSFITSLLS